MNEQQTILGLAIEGTVARYRDQHGPTWPMTRDQILRDIDQRTEPGISRKMLAIAAAKIAMREQDEEAAALFIAAVYDPEAPEPEGKKV